MVWRLPAVEYRITLVDEHSRPVPGVTLQVLTKSGGASPFYPVNEFLPDQAPTSDTDGRMVFHHVSARAIEFGGHDHRSLVGISYGTPDAPEYDCVFMLDGREVNRTSFHSLRGNRDEFEKRPTIKREWKTGAETLLKYAPQPGEADDWRMRLFDGNRDGKLDREERTAAGNFE